MATLALKSQWSLRSPLDHKIVVICKVYQGRGQAVDLDNALGGIFDAMQKAKIIKNDYDIVRITAERFDTERHRPRCEIILEPACLKRS